MTTSTQNAGSAAEQYGMDFSAVAEADLLDWMGAAGACPDEARAAFTEFYRRHAKYLYARCLKAYPNHAEEVVSETFLRAYQRAATFDVKRLTKDGQPEREAKKVRAWLGRIAHNVAADMFAAREKEPVTRSGTTSLPDDWGEECEQEESAGTDELIERVREIVNSLPAREREIAWVMAHSWQPDENANRWSRADLAAIAERFQETPENIRQIKHRLHTKLTKLLAPVLTAGASDR